MSNNEQTSADPVAPVAEPAPPPAHRPSRARRVVPVIVLLALIGTAVWYFFLRQPVTATNVVKVSGRIEADDSAIAAKVAGRIREITVREGDIVKAGQTIATLDDEQAKEREVQAQAAVEQAETRVRRATQQLSVINEQINQSDLTVDQARLDARGRVSQAESQVAAAESQLAQAESNYQQAQYDAEKFERLFKTGDVSERQYKQAQTTLASQLSIVRSQRKQVDAARSALTVARASLANPKIRSAQTATLREQFKQAQSDVDAANADADKARAALREVTANRTDLTVVAPFDGTITTRVVEPGEVVTAGTTLVKLVNLNAIYLRGFVPEGQIGNVKIGQPVRVFLDSDSNHPLDAEVTRIDPEATFTPENTYFQNERVKQVVGVKLAIKVPDGSAKPGMPADGEILISGEWPGPGRTE